MRLDLSIVFVRLLWFENLQLVFHLLNSRTSSFRRRGELTASTTVGFILCSIRDFPSLASIWLLGKYLLFIFVFNKGFSQFGKYWVIRQVSVIFM
jgi:hypothetical protein